MCWFTCQPANFKGTSKYKNNHTLSNRNVCRNSSHATEYEVDSLEIQTTEVVEKFRTTTKMNVFIS